MKPTGMMVGTLLAALAAAVPAGADEDAPAKAFATLTGCSDSGVGGVVRFQEEKSEEGVKQVRVRLRIVGLEEGKHAVHIHETGECEPSCLAAGGHFDPGPASFPSPDGNHPYHSGDLINVEVVDGVGEMRTVTNRVTLSPGPLSVFDDDGSAVIVHVNPDTYCPDGEETGCAGGARAACGIITAVE